MPDKGEQLSISYSHEGRDFGGALETAGGIARALPLLGDIFWLAAGDVFAPDFRFDVAAAEAFAASGMLAHLWLVPNPAHNPHGDFGLSPDGLALNLPPESTQPRHTYSTIARPHPPPPPARRLRPSACRPGANPAPQTHTAPPPLQPHRAAARRTVRAQQRD